MFEDAHLAELVTICVVPLDMVATAENDALPPSGGVEPRIVSDLTTGAGSGGDGAVALGPPHADTANASTTVTTRIAITTGPLGAYTDGLLRGATPSVKSDKAKRLGLKCK